MEYLFETWPWYVAGPIIGVLAFLLYWAGENFGFSSNLRHFCTIMGAGKFSDFFKYDWKTFKWSYAFVIGSVIGGFVAANWLTIAGFEVAINEATKSDLRTLGISDFSGLVPSELFNWSFFSNTSQAIVVLLGGFFIGFGTRYAGGCTSGHAISGLGNMQLPSLIAVIGFFIGGLLSTHILLPILL